MALIKGYPVKNWVGQVPAEQRAAVLCRIANHGHGQGEVDWA